MQVDYGHGVAQHDLPGHLTQWCHRLAIIGTLLVAGVVVAMVAGKSPGPTAWVALLVADVAVLLAGIALVLTYRQGRSPREVLGVFFFALVLAHIPTYWLLSNYRGLMTLRELLIGWGIVKP